MFPQEARSPYGPEECNVSAGGGVFTEADMPPSPGLRNDYCPAPRYVRLGRGQIMITVRLHDESPLELDACCVILM